MCLSESRWIHMILNIVHKQPCPLSPVSPVVPLKRVPEIMGLCVPWAPVSQLSSTPQLWVYFPRVRPVLPLLFPREQKGMCPVFAQCPLYFVLYLWDTVWEGTGKHGTHTTIYLGNSKGDTGRTRGTYPYIFWDAVTGDTRRISPVFPLRCINNV